MTFAEKVYDIVKKIPRGKVLTYRAVARLAGSPRAFRAVGSVLNKNPDLKNIPCHRVIKTNGDAGNYKFGRKNKEALLKKEGVVIRRGRIVR